MKRVSRVAAPLLVALCCTFSPAQAAPLPATGQHASQSAQAIHEIATATSELRLADAEKALAQLDPQQPDVMFERARLDFYLGKYPQARALGERALAHASAHDQRRAMLELIAQTEEVTRDYERQVSSDGRYDVLYPRGKDGLLADYALSVLVAADQALTRILGMPLPGPVRLEIYPSPATLAEVSALTEDQIRTTGTVALSKWNRLMITSPKALVRGYPWADTITHEMVHMVVSRITDDRAPVWLQEGTAKLLERSWRKRDAGLSLDAGSRALLYEANKKNKLITFEQMHPSIAMLPSEDDAALAFAQVSTLIERFVQKYGDAALREALAQVRDGVDARAALASAAKLPFAKLEQDWRSSLPDADPDASTRRLSTRFRTGDGPTDDTTDVVEDGARRFLRIGDLLWDRGRKGGAAREYEKAYKADQLDPIVAARWARASITLGDAQAVITALEPQLARHPGYAPTYALLGRARLQLGERDAAQRELREAIWINPFDPDPHCDLARASDTPSERDHERRVCEALE